MPKVICVISHDKPGKEPERFDRYISGQEYDLDEYDPTKFTLIQDAQRSEEKHKKKQINFKEEVKEDADN